MTSRLSRASSPAGIEDDLAMLWREAGQAGPVARALMANLVIYCERGESLAVDLAALPDCVPIAEVVQRHPSRVIVLYHGGRATASAPLGAAISILLFGDKETRYGVEEIALRASCADASLPSIVRRLALGDVPTSILWAEDLSQAAPPGPLVAMGRQLIYDSRRWRDVRGGILALSAIGNVSAKDLADLNWRRLTPMRRAITEALRLAAAGHESITGLRIGHRPGDRALAWLLAGWISSRLGWAADRPWPITIAEARRGDDMLWVSGGAEDAPAFTASMNGHRVLVTSGGRPTPFAIAVPHESVAEAIASELHTLAHDAVLCDTLRALAARLTSSAAL